MNKPGQSFALTSTLLLLALSASACILEPGDGEIIVDEDAPVTFQGATWQPNTTVELEYWGQKCSGGFIGVPLSCWETWLPLGTTVSSGSSVTWDGLPGYTWQASFVVPGLNGCGLERKARVRARAAGSLLSSIVPDWYSCWGDNPNWFAFFSSCLGMKDPEVTLFPSDPVACPPPSRYGFPLGRITSGCSKTPGDSCGSGYPAGCGPNAVAEPVRVPKVWDCQNGKDVCKFIGPGVEGSYCIVSGEGGCGAPFGSRCNRNSDCFPGTRCVLQYNDVARCSNTTSQCQGAVPHCWPVAEKENLCAFD